MLTFLKSCVWGGGGGGGARTYLGVAKVALNAPLRNAYLIKYILL